MAHKKPHAKCKTNLKFDALNPTPQLKFQKQKRKQAPETHTKPTRGRRTWTVATMGKHSKHTYLIPLNLVDIPATHCWWL